MCSFEAKNVEKLKHLYKQQFLMQITYILCKISVIEYSYLSLIEQLYNRPN
jgi:hypothetical protein